MSIFNVDAATCRKDALCVKACPVGVIAGSVEKLPRQVFGTDENCIACGHCMVYCPTSACSIEGVQAPVPLDRSALPDGEAVSLLCKARRSTRNYRKAPLEKTEIEELLDVARYAPSAKNSQCVRWVVVYEREKIVELGNLLAQWMLEVGANNPEMPGSNESAGLAKRWQKGRDVFFHNCPHLVVAIAPKDYYWGTVDATIALSYLELAAAAKGLGLCWAGYFVAGVAHYEPLQKALGMSSDEIMPGCLMLGKPALKASRMPARRPANVHWL